MRRSRALYTVAISTTVILASGCALMERNGLDVPLYGPTAADTEGLTPKDYEGSLGAARLDKFVAMYRLLGQSEARARNLETRLAEAEAELARVQGQRVSEEAEPQPEIEAVSEPSLPSPPPGGISTVVLSNDQDLVVTALREELAAEREKRDQLQAELDRLRSETSAGPFERDDDVALQRAQQEIAGLKNALRQEGEARDEALRQYEDLQARMQNQSGDDAALEENAKLRAQIGRLNQNSRQEMNSLQQQLQGSMQREQQLRTQLAAAQQNENDGAASLEQQQEIDSLRTELQGSVQREQNLKTQLASARQNENESAVVVQENANLRDQIGKMKIEQQQEVDSLRVELQDSVQREQSLQAQLASAQQAVAGASAAEIAALKAQNDSLRAQIAAEQRRSAELDAKLRTAMRVSDVIFRLEKQEAR